MDLLESDADWCHAFNGAHYYPLRPPLDGASDELQGRQGRQERQEHQGRLGASGEIGVPGVPGAP